VPAEPKSVALAGVLGRLLACSLALSGLAVPCRVFVPDGEDRTWEGRGCGGT
jgi:hypothetical protein